MRPLVLVALGLGSAGLHAATINFSQVSWSNETGGFVQQFSNHGMANMSFGSGDAGSFFSHPTGGLYGYVNIVASFGGGASNSWIVQNKVMHFPTLASLNSRMTDRVYFDLGNSIGQQVGAGAQFFMTIDANPLASQPSGGPASTNVQQEDQLYGGLEGGGTGSGPPQPPTNFQGAPAGSNLAASACISIAEPNVAAIDEDKNGCAPASVARSLAYLNTRYGLGITKTAQQMYNELKSSTYMMSSLGAGGSGTSLANMLSGKRNWTRDNNLPITSSFSSSPAEAFAALAAGYDVEFLHLPPGRIGHAAFISYMRCIRDGAGNVIRYEVDVIDDPKQGDSTAANNKHTYAIGTSGSSQFLIECVPEPGSMAALALGVSALIMRRRRKRAK